MERGLKLKRRGPDVLGLNGFDERFVLNGTSGGLSFVDRTGNQTCLTYTREETRHLFLWMVQASIEPKLDDAPPVCLFGPGGDFVREYP